MCSDDTVLRSLKMINDVNDIRIGLKDINLMINKEIARIKGKTENEVL